MKQEAQQALACGQFTINNCFAIIKRNLSIRFLINFIDSIYIIFPMCYYEKKLYCSGGGTLDSTLRTRTVQYVVKNIEKNNILLTHKLQRPEGQWSKKQKSRFN